MNSETLNFTDGVVERDRAARLAIERRQAVDGALARLLECRECGPEVVEALSHYLRCCRALDR